jgi:two-component system, LuxR family, sensor kinase FixL
MLRKENLSAGIPWLMRQAALHAGLFLAFLAMSWLASIFQATELRTSPWTPSTGLAFIAGLILGRPAILTATLCMLVSTRLWGWSLPGGWEFVSAVVRALIFTGSAVALRPWLIAEASNSIQGVTRLLIISVGVTLVYALARLLVLWLSVGVEPSYLLSYTATLSIGNLIAMMTIVPFALSAGGLAAWMAYARRWSGIQWLFCIILVLSSIIVFGIRETDEFKFFYFIFLPVIAFSVKDGLKGAALSVFLSDALMLFILYLRSYETSTATELQFLMLSLSVTGLFLGAAISDRERAVEQLAESHLNLQESQSALLQASRLSLASEIAAALAHELNQPLSSIRNYVRAVKRRIDSGGADPNAVQADIDSAVIQVDAAAALLRSTRNFLERGEAHQQRMALDDVVSSSLALMEPELHKAGIELRLAGPLPLCMVLCNEVQIQQVILNLLRNAKESITASGERRADITVSVSLTNRPGFAEISVRDKGGGVAPETQSVLFQPLKSAKPDGLGLGLSLCKSIVRAHGGELWLDQSSSTGATFVFTLPVVAHKGSKA